MKKKIFKVKEDCFCEHYIHELTNYPRPGLKELKLLKGEEVELVNEWSNFYGSYLRVQKGNDKYDIPPNKLEEIK